MTLPSEDSRLSLIQENHKLAAERDALRVELAQAQAELAKWQSGEIFSEHAAQLYEEQRKRIAELEQALLPFAKLTEHWTEIHCERQPEIMTHQVLYAREVLGLPLPPAPEDKEQP